MEVDLLVEGGAREEEEDAKEVWGEVVTLYLLMWRRLRREPLLRGFPSPPQEGREEGGGERGGGGE